MSVDDIDDVLSKRRSSTINTNVTDDDLALALFAEEAEGLLNVTKDHLVDGVVSEELLAELMEIEETAQYDHLMAIALSEGREPPPRPLPRNRGKNRASSQLQHSHASSNQRHDMPGPRPDIQRGRSPTRSGSSSGSAWQPISPVHSLPTRASSPEEYDGAESSVASSPVDHYPRIARSPDRNSLSVPEPYEEEEYEPSEVGEYEPSRVGEYESYEEQVYETMSRPGSPDMPSMPPSPFAAAFIEDDFPLLPHRAPSLGRYIATEPETLPSCMVCGDEIAGSIIYAPCGHVVDAACLRVMFENATRDEALFPPKCCQEPIELTDVEAFLDTSLKELYQRKSREFSIKDRVYCHVPACSAFLGGASTAPIPRTCTSPSCNARTCGSCKYAAHPGEACKDHSDDAVLELGQAQGWQRCPSCQHLVELTVGCYHMTCRCRKEFCYLCAKTWKTCSCPRFDDVPDTPPEIERPALVRHNAAAGVVQRLQVI